MILALRLERSAAFDRGLITIANDGALVSGALEATSGATLGPVRPLRMHGMVAL